MSARARVGGAGGRPARGGANGRARERAHALALPSPPPFLPSAVLASVESVKAASDVYAPVSGTVTAVNATLANDTGAVNKDAEGAAWFVKLALDDAKEADALMDAAAYKKLCDAEKH